MDTCIWVSYEEEGLFWKEFIMINVNISIMSIIDEC